MKLTVTNSQMNYEFGHLFKKLKTRDKTVYKKIKNIKKPEPNPLFLVTHGKIEDWEKVR